MNVQQVIALGGVELMITHLTPTWDPPIKEIFESYSSNRVECSTVVRVVAY